MGKNKRGQSSIFGVAEWIVIIIMIIVVVYLFFNFFENNESKTNSCLNLDGRCVENKDECNDKEEIAYEGMGCPVYCCVPLSAVGIV